MSRKGWEDKYNELKALTEQQIDQKIKECKYYSENPKKIPDSKVADSKLKDKGGKPLSQKDKEMVLKTSVDKELLTLESFKKNKEKIAKYIEYRNILHKRIEKLSNGPMAEVIKAEALDKQRKEIEKNIQKKVNDLNAEMAKSNKDPKKISKINGEITKLTEQKQNNFNERIASQRKINQMKKDGIDGQPFDEKSMTKMLRDMQAATVKCDMLCALLMQGKGINDLKFDRTKVQYRAPKKVDQSTKDTVDNSKSAPKSTPEPTPKSTPEPTPKDEKTKFSFRHPIETTKAIMSERKAAKEKGELAKRPRFNLLHPIKSIKSIIDANKEKPVVKDDKDDKNSKIGTPKSAETVDERDEISDSELKTMTELFLEKDEFVEEMGTKADFRDSLKFRKSASNNYEKLAQEYEKRALTETDPAKKKIWEAKKEEYTKKATNTEKPGLTQALEQQDQTVEHMQDDEGR